jgi:hypothetical protein
MDAASVVQRGYSTKYKDNRIRFLKTQDLKNVLFHVYFDASTDECIAYSKNYHIEFWYEGKYHPYCYQWMCDYLSANGASFVTRCLSEYDASKVLSDEVIEIHIDKHVPKADVHAHADAHVE